MIVTPAARCHTQEIKKYDSLVADVDKNLAAQDALLAATGGANASFRTLFDVTGWRSACEAAAAGVREVRRAGAEAFNPT